MSTVRFAKVRTTSFRGTPAAPAGDSHAVMVESLSDGAIAGIIAAAERRNLRDQRDHEIRWLSERSSAARLVRRERKAAGTWHP